MKKILMDSWAWLELFKGTETGKKIKERIQQAERIYTTTVNVYEVLYREEQNQGRESAEKKKEFIEHQCVVQDITLPIVVEALRVKRVHKLAAIDSLTLAAGNTLDATLLTGDPDFKNMENVDYVGP